MNPLLSIVLPLFNSEEYIERTINSVASSIENQEDTVEVLLVDDGSTDSTVEIVKNVIALKPCFRLLLTEHSGVSGTRNRGLSEAKGEYITFFDSDDLFKNGYVKLLKQVLDSNDKPDLIITDINQDKLEKVLLESDSDRMPLLESLVDIGKVRCSSGIHSKFYKKQFLVDHKIQFNDNLVMAEDLLFNFEVVKKAKNVLLTQFDFYYQLENHTMHKFREYNLQNEKLFNQLLEAYFKDYQISGKLKPLIKLRLTGYMFLLNWYFADLLATNKISLNDCSEQIKQIAESGHYTEAFKDDEFDGVIGRKHAIFRKLLLRGHYKLVLVLNSWFWKVKH